MTKKRKLGGGIITISIILLIGIVFGIGVGVTNLVKGEEINELLLQTGEISPDMLPTTQDYIIGLITNVLGGIFIVLILMKNKVGVLGYFGVSIMAMVYGLLSNEITTAYIVGQLLNIALLGLYGFFIYRKKYIFGFTNEITEVK